MYPVLAQRVLICGSLRSRGVDGRYNSARFGDGERMHILEVAQLRLSTQLLLLLHRGLRAGYLLRSAEDGGRRGGTRRIFRLFVHGGGGCRSEQWRSG